MNQEIGPTQYDIPIFKGAKTNIGPEDIVAACIATHRRMELHYTTKSKRKKFDIVFTKEDLEKIIQFHELEFHTLDDSYQLSGEL